MLRLPSSPKGREGVGEVRAEGRFALFFALTPAPLPRERGRQALTAEVSAQLAWMFSKLRKSCQITEVA